MSTTKTVILGRLPAFIGEWEEGHTYHKFNKVVYHGAEFTSTIEGNTNIPATLHLDSSNMLERYEVNYGWILSSNSYDGEIYVKNIADEINEDYNFTPGYTIVEDTSTSNPQYKYVKYNIQELTLQEQAQARRNIGAVSEDTMKNVAFFDIVETI